MIKVARAVMGPEEHAAVREALDRGYYGLAEKVNEFENAVKSYLGTEHVVAVNNGTSALHLALDVAGAGDGDEILVPSLTFVASFQAISMTGATPVACDVSADTLLLDIQDAGRKITKKTKAVMPVHYAGNPCDMDALLSLCEKHGLRIVEDAAHAFGSLYKGKKIGSFGDMTCFSFDSIKVITCGEGGVVVCRDAQTEARLRHKRLLGMDRMSHGKEWKERSWSYDVAEKGYRYHMSNINAAIGLEQLKKVDVFIARRREICEAYRNDLQHLPGVCFLDIHTGHIAPFMFVVRVKNGKRDALMQFLKDHDVETGIHYVPNHLHTLYRNDGIALPQTEKAFDEILSLPLHAALSDEDVERVCSLIKEFLAGASQDKAKAGSAGRLPQ